MKWQFYGSQAQADAIQARAAQAAAEEVAADGFSGDEIMGNWGFEMLFDPLWSIEL